MAVPVGNAVSLDPVFPHTDSMMKLAVLIAAFHHARRIVPVGPSSHNLAVNLR